jgi:hypothetical protein
VSKLTICKSGWTRLIPYALLITMLAALSVTIWTHCQRFIGALKMGVTSISTAIAVHSRHNPPPQIDPAR